VKYGAGMKYYPRLKGNYFMHIETMQEALAECGCVTTTIKPGFFHVPCLAVQTEDPATVMEFLTDYFGFCPHYDWKLIKGRGYLYFSEYIITD
jgi:hypothetical protein